MHKSMNGSTVKKPRSWNKNVILELLFLASVLWVSHYFYFRSFGLYEDDYAYTSPQLGWQLPDLIHSLTMFVTWRQGRPLGVFLCNLLAFLGGKLGGLSMIYIIGYVVQTTNVFLFYFLLRRIGQGTIALIGAMTFGLFPADTTHIFLMHALGLHTSLTFLLVASHFYLSGHKTLAHLLSLGSLLTYESPYMVFLAIPLLCRPWDKRLVKEMIRHIVVWLGILVAVVAIRAVLGEGRIESVGTSSSHIFLIFRQIVAALVIGPATSLSIFWSGPAWTLSHWNRELTFVFVGCVPVFAWMMSRLKTGVLKEAGGSFIFPVKFLSWKNTIQFTIPRPHAIKLLVTAIIMLSLAYGFSFTHYPPTVTYGRVTSVHLAAAFGGALLFACCSSFFLDFFKSRRLGTVGVLILALYISLIVAYRFSIQQDFKKAWQNEQRFWTNAIAQLPDMGDGTIIFVVNHHLPGSHFIETNSWSDPLILKQIFQFPSDWENPPRLFVVSPDWEGSLVWEKNHFNWLVPAAVWKPHWEVLPDSNVIFMEWKNGKLVRQYGSLMIQGQIFHLKQLTLTVYPGWKKGALFPLLITGLK